MQTHTKRKLESISDKTVISFLTAVTLTRPPYPPRSPLAYSTRSSPAKDRGACRDLLNLRWNAGSRSRPSTLRALHLTPLAARPLQPWIEIKIVGPATTRSSCGGYRDWPRRPTPTLARHKVALGGRARISRSEEATKQHPLPGCPSAPLAGYALTAGVDPLRHFASLWRRSDLFLRRAASRRPRQHLLV